MGRWGARLCFAVVLGALAACTDDDLGSQASPTQCAPGAACSPAGAPPPPPPCLTNQQPCPGGCADLQASSTNCGQCGRSCAPGEVCQAGACTNVCGQGLGFCGGACVNLASHPLHCGGCDRACPGGQLCSNSVCSATCDQTVCMGVAGPECASLTDDRSHCGTCNHACPMGDTCVDGVCVLDCGQLTACGGACVDVQTDNAHCGMCGVACPMGQMCSGGACICAMGLAACGDACIDTTMDPSHCGGCDMACGNGYLCEGGKCVGPDGCTDTPVTGLSLSAVDAYQTVQIAIMEEGTAVGSGQRNADVVVGRPTMFRIHVTPGTDWSAREVSARLELTDVAMPAPADKTLFFGKQTPTGPSSDGELDSTFQVKVPADAIGPDTRYAITLVECEGSTGAATPGAGRARFPAQGFEDLAARETGPLKVHIIPISGTDVTEEGLEPFRERLEAVYPITEVQFTIGESLTSFAGSMCSLLSSVTSRRSQDNPPNDVYYYGQYTSLGGLS